MPPLGMTRAEGGTGRLLPSYSVPLYPALEVTSPLKRLIVFWSLAAAVCALALRYAFPGYFDPFVPFHIDHFTYMGLSAKGYGFLRYFDFYPRPMGYVLIDLCGRLGIRGLFVPLYVCSLLNAALLAIYIERITKLRIALACFVFYAVLAYMNPQFYWNLKQDPLAVFSLTFLLLLFHSWQSYLEKGRTWFLLAALLLAVLFSLTKESYFGVLGLFCAAQVLLVPSRRKSAILLLAVSVTGMAWSLHRASQVWTLFQKNMPTDNAYYTNMTPASMLHGLVKIGEYCAAPALLLVMAALLILAFRRDRKIFCVSVAALCFAVASLLPNSTLPNHLEPHYAFLAGYFFLVPFLFLDKLFPKTTPWRVGLVVASFVLIVVTRNEYKRSETKGAGWLREQEAISQQLLIELNQMRLKTAPLDSSLIIGMTMPFTPYYAPEFIGGYMGWHRFWTVVVPQSGEESVNDTTRLIHEDNPARFENYDHLFVFARDGMLERSIDHPPSTVIASEMARRYHEPPMSGEQVAAVVARVASKPGFGRAVFYASPNPVPVDGSGLGQTTVYWVAPRATKIELHVGSPTGPLFAAGGPAGKATTGQWVHEGTVFYLVDAATHDTLQILSVGVKRPEN